ncbi:hypothetical protein M8C13_09125 [Crossiella sp. SN42]|nr:hypothetical protein [Crossiella sp. SN42]MCO1575918.1 hypothetical protein [Crossiella sp. SN42]
MYGHIFVVHRHLLAFIGLVPPWERDDHRFFSGAGHGSDGLAGQRDPTDRDTSREVVVDLQAECLEQAPGQVVGEIFKIELADWQLVQQDRIRSNQLLLLQLVQLLLQPLPLDTQLRATFLDVPEQIRLVLVGDLQALDEAPAPLLVVGDLPAHGRQPPEAFLPGVVIEHTEVGRQQITAMLTEDVLDKEAVQPGQDLVLAHPEDHRMVFRPPRLLGRAGVVADVLLGVAEHATTALGAEQVAAEAVHPHGSRRAPHACRSAGLLAPRGDLLGEHEGLQVDELIVHRCRRPDPFADGVDPVLPFALPGAPVPDHVPGVLGVGEQLAHAGVGPVAERTRRIHRGRGRVQHEVLVEFVGDGLERQPLVDPPAEHLGHHQPFDLVGDQPGLLEALGPLGGHRVRDVVSAEAVTRLADVVALLGVGLEAVPALFEHLQHVPLGDALLDPPRQHRGRRLDPAAGSTEVERLVGGDQPDTHLFKAVLDLGGDVVAPADAADFLADHHVEPPVRALSFLQQVLDAAVPGDGDLEHPVGVAPAPCFQIKAAGLDVVEVRDDHGVVWQRVLAVAQLPRQGQRRILQVVGRSPSCPGHPDDAGLGATGSTVEQTAVVYAAWS